MGTIRQPQTDIDTTIPNTYYVAKNGSDTTGDGSLAFPYLTIQKAIDVSTPSDPVRYTINIFQGIYVEQVTLKPFITLFAAPDTVVIQNDSDYAVIAPTSMGHFGCDLVNINILNAGTGGACHVENNGSIAFVGGSVSANDEDGLLVEGDGFVLGTAIAGFFSNVKNGANLKDTSIGIFYNCTFYSGDLTATYFDLNMAVGTIYKYNDDNDFQGTGANILSGTQIPISKAKYESYDNTLSGLTAINTQDAIDEIKSNFSDGTYNPTLTAVTNVSASTSYDAQYMRLGNTVTVSGQFDLDPTAAVSLTQLGISLPIASNFSAANQCGGVASSASVLGYVGPISADATNDRAQFDVIVGADVANHSWWYTFTYQVI